MAPARDIEWVYSTLANRKVRPEDARSLGAWSMLKWARHYKNGFFETLLPKALAAKEKRAEADRSGEALPGKIGRDMGIEEVLAILKSTGKDVPSTVQGHVNQVLHDWSRRFGLAITAEAQTNLGANLAGWSRTP